MAASENFVAACLSGTIEIIEAGCSKRVRMPKVVLAGGAFGDGFRGWRIVAGSVVHGAIEETIVSRPGKQGTEACPDTAGHMCVKYVHGPCCTDRLVQKVKGQR